MLAELGLVGLVLFAAAIVGARDRRRCAPAASARPRRRSAAVALASGAYWLVHTSLDWFWPYPAITAPGARPARLRLRARGPRRSGAAARGRWRGWLIAALARARDQRDPALALGALRQQRLRELAHDLARAYDDLDRARQPEPAQRHARCSPRERSRAQAGDRERALDAFREAAEMRPEEWATHYLLAELQAESDPAAARNEIRVALELNPLDARVPPARARARRRPRPPRAERRLD